MAEHHDRLGPEHRDTVFEARDQFRGCDVTGHAGDEQMPDTLVENQFDRDSLIHTGQHCSEGLLLFHRLRFENAEILVERGHASFGKTGVAVDQLLQCRVRAQ